ncbi:MAG: EF-P lysine aminoacylase GenX [Fibrobacter sp.]|jgi:lysyl-tRNA synthetase-like protein GenX|uniref:EF-P lysine aminoacylase EpmA n=1 Tax=Fibrobacter sp. TaxID=35828 RepID=UPI0025C43F30|nr:EF-P lysine aminoacylase EpmA [Fibrobacter sp.]MBQ7078896.1 EF-P lysine aminoacylase GenX [Fibrobacter sp.]
MENLKSGAFAPTCSRETWIKRQALMTKVRDFFVRRNALEVETPVLSAYGGTDPQLDYFEIEDPKRFMMTSPEFHMKRLLAANFGDIFQITKSFRKDEFGGHHNNEFSMVEWYRVGMPQEKLMDEVEDLVSEIIGTKLNARRTRWIDAFKNYAGIDPFSEKLSDFADACRTREIPVPEKSETLTREEWWDYMMVFLVEPALASNGPEFILDYPPSQAALAQTYTDADGRVWARRFELFVNQVELCNGYTELTDAVEQRRRFNADLDIRRAMNKPLPPLDERFLAALESGMPACSGVALGLDRLFMLALGKEEIADVILFPSPIA